MSLPEKDNAGRQMMVITMAFAGSAILSFGIVQILNKQMIAGALMIGIGLFDLAMIVFVLKKL